MKALKHIAFALIAAGCLIDMQPCKAGFLATAIVACQIVAVGAAIYKYATHSPKLETEKNPLATCLRAWYPTPHLALDIAGIIYPTFRVATTLASIAMLGAGTCNISNTNEQQVSDHTTYSRENLCNCMAANTPFLLGELATVLLTRYLT